MWGKAALGIVALAASVAVGPISASQADDSPGGTAASPSAQPAVQPAATSAAPSTSHAASSGPTTAADDPSTTPPPTTPPSTTPPPTTPPPTTPPPTTPPPTTPPPTTPPGHAALRVNQQLVLAADADHDGRADAGDGVRVVVTVTNSGTVRLHAVGVSDALVKRLGGSVTCATRVLAPGASTTCRSGLVRVTRTQAKAGVFRNQATGTALSPQEAAVVSATTTATLPVQHPATRRHHKGHHHKGHHHKGHHHKGHHHKGHHHKGHHHKGHHHKGHHHKGHHHKGHHHKQHRAHRPVAKLRMTQYILAITDVNRNGRLEAGDAVRFGFHVVNAGTVSLNGVHIVDRRLERFHVGVTCGSTSLAPGASTECSSGAMKITPYQAKKHKLGRNFAYALATSAATGGSVHGNSTKITLTSDIRALPDTGSTVRAWTLWGSAMLIVGGTLLAGFGGRLRRRSAGTRPS